MNHQAMGVQTLFAAIAFAVTLHATEPRTASEYPAKIELIESKPKVMTRFSVKMHAERGVDIYANEPQNEAFNHAGARLVVHDAEGNHVDATVAYPRGIKVDAGFLGDLYVYRNSVEMNVVVPSDTRRPLSVTLTGAGYNRLRDFCLGKMELQSAFK